LNEESEDVTYGMNCMFDFTEAEFKKLYGVIPPPQLSTRAKEYSFAEVDSQ